MAVRSRVRKAAEPLEESALYEYAVKALGRRMRTIAELERLMRGKVEPGEAGESKIASVVARLKEYRYLDDRSFASVYTRLRQENQGFGKRRVQQELSRKGVDREVIAGALEAAYGGASEEELARRYLERKRIGKPGSPKETARLIRRLVTAGFSISVVSKVLRSWQVEVQEDDLAMPQEPGEP